MVKQARPETAGKEWKNQENVKTERKLSAAMTVNARILRLSGEPADWEIVSYEATRLGDLETARLRDCETMRLRVLRVLRVCGNYPPRGQKARVEDAVNGG